MKKSIYFALSLAVLLCGPSVSDAFGQNVTGQVIRRMNAHFEALQTLQAKVERSMYNTQLKEGTDYEGKLLLIPSKEKKVSAKAEKNTAMRLDWTKPRQETLTVWKGQYVLFVPGINRAYYGSASSKNVKSGGGSALGAITMSEAELRANYETPVMLSENAKIKDGTGTFHLRLVPKIKSNFQFAEIWVDTDGMPRQVMVKANNGDTDTFYLSRINKNATINTSEFQVNVGNAQRIKQ